MFMELQRLYGEMYNSCDDISKRLNDLDTDESNIDIISRVSDSMNILKKYIQKHQQKVKLIIINL